MDAIGSLEDFANYWLAKAGKDATKVDWDRTFVTWVKRDIERGKARPLEQGDAEREWQPSPTAETAATPAEVKAMLAELAKSKSVDTLLAREEALHG